MRDAVSLTASDDPYRRHRRSHAAGLGGQFVAPRCECIGICGKAGARMDHSSLMDLAHWLGVALATPAAAVVLLASWRAARERRSPDSHLEADR
jgi:hypothetical protein